MQTVNIHEAKTNLSRLVEEAAQGNSFIIAKAGKPMVKVLPLSAEDRKGVEKLGFMEGEISVPDDFDSLGAPEIMRLFKGKPNNLLL
jgi:prevent-host-death family protein